MQTLAPVIASGRHDEDTAVAAETNGIVQPGVGLSRVREFTAADVDDLGAIIDCQLDRAR